MIHEEILALKDLFATDRPEIVINAEVSDPVSDHCCVTATLSLHSQLPCKQTISRFDYARADWRSFRATLHATSLRNTISSTDNVDIVWSVWKEKLRESTCKHIPVCTFTVLPGIKPWMTAQLLRVRPERLRRFKMAVRTKRTLDWERYARVRNDCNREFEKAKHRYSAQVQSSINEESAGSDTW